MGNKNRNYKSKKKKTIKESINYISTWDELEELEDYDNLIEEIYQAINSHANAADMEADRLSPFNPLKPKKWLGTFVDTIRNSVVTLNYYRKIGKKYGLTKQLFDELVDKLIDDKYGNYFIQH